MHSCTSSRQGGNWGGDAADPAWRLVPPRWAREGPIASTPQGSRTGPVWRPHRRLRRRRGTRITCRLDARPPPRGACDAPPAPGPRGSLCFCSPPAAASRGCRATDTNDHQSVRSQRPAPRRLGWGPGTGVRTEGCGEEFEAPSPGWDLFPRDKLWGGAVGRLRCLFISK